jgi:hypothetical protein
MLINTGEAPDCRPDIAKKPLQFHVFSQIPFTHKTEKTNMVQIAWAFEVFYKLL